MKTIKDYRVKQEKKYHISVGTLFKLGATHVLNDNDDIFLITEYQNYINIRLGNKYFTMNECLEKGYLWTSDRKTWHSFEEEKNT